MKIKSYILPVALFSVAAFSSCQEDMEKFDNSVYAPTETPVTTVNVKPGMDSFTGYVEANLSKKEDADVTVTFFADPSKVDLYNALYTQNYLELPSKYCRIPQASAVIPAGGDNTGKVAVEFMKLDELDVTKTYVLPVSMSSSVESLTNSTYYFVVKEASIVSVVADMTDNFAVFAAPNQAPELSGMTQITVQALLYPYDFPRTLHTIMGIEGYFLLRVGDANFPANELQLATSNGNVFDDAWKFDTNTWTEFTLTYDCETGATNVYFNGVKKGATQYGNFRGPINWNTASGDIDNGGPRGFYVGYSYNDERSFNGEMAELRVWNRVLTEEEIKAPYQAYSVEPDSPGLVAYWKLDEGAGNLFHDYANSYDLKCNTAPNWIPVSLPKK